MVRSGTNAPATLNRRDFSAALLAGAAASMISSRGTVARAASPKMRNVVLVHGLFADGSCWTEVIARLQAAGLNATSVQNPLTTLPEAVAAAERVLARQDGPTVLVGHSFSGMIVTEAGMHSNVSSLVYVAARAPDAGEDYTALAKTYPAPPASAGIVFDGDEGRLSEAAFLRDFAGDLPGKKAKVLYAVQQPFNKALLAGKTTNAAWRSKPSYYAVSTEDRTINPDLQRFMAKRMGARTLEVKGSHLALISHPDEITRLILEAAAGKGLTRAVPLRKIQAALAGGLIHIRPYRRRGLNGATTEFDGVFRERYPMPAGTLVVCLGCSWNGRPNRDVWISPLEAGPTTLRPRSYDWSHAGLLTSPLQAPSRGLMPLRSRYRGSRPPGTPCFGLLRTLP